MSITFLGSMYHACESAPEQYFGTWPEKLVTDSTGAVETIQKNLAFCTVMIDPCRVFQVNQPVIEHVFCINMIDPCRVF